MTVIPIAIAALMVILLGPVSLQADRPSVTLEWLTLVASCRSRICPANGSYCGGQYKTGLAASGPSPAAKRQLNQGPVLGNGKVGRNGYCGVITSQKRISLFEPPLCGPQRDVPEK